MKTAYEALHMQEIMQGAVTQTARAVEKGVTENIRAKGQRPAEAGLATAAGVEIKSDPSKLTRKGLAAHSRAGGAGRKNQILNGGRITMTEAYLLGSEELSFSLQLHDNTNVTADSGMTPGDENLLGYRADRQCRAPSGA